MAYTPIFDSLFEVDKINLTDVAVFGAVWRYAQGELKKCIAGPKTIGERIGLSHNPVRLSLRKLCDLGLLTDLTPAVSHKIHEYIPTEKALRIIARQSKEETESKPEETPIYNERLPETGNLKQVTQDERLPETGNPGYQNPVGRLPESGNEERINRESIREGEEAPAHVHEDYLDSVINGQGKTSEKTDSNPEDQWFEYRDRALKAFPGDWGRTVEEKEIKKNLILGLVANNPEFNPDHWAFVIQDSIGHGVGSNNIARFIEVYPFKNYEAWLASKFPRSENGRDSPISPPKPALRIVPVESNE